ncbi:hypothetical protein BX616_009710 [Lobosporangium transversale]|uniref:Uncharacterized protein n=1 Tax=Lobosporangium transversale TaxID=64571 RepID=A0A1Y2GZY8_9FUNG|nr:hypothetical protein BCR41DRAFT_367429 [Lobosporangium transversale]KAF9913709.1 hypothetical protein BX616_009710 [Lobosporangium transversale]ORZ27878.1 hypothetical protein BCR41DRAFT_367429 [Lobosporangium transversale]|eukprot:XP_021885581.1 hypothetical protein BCR41DRAFT_367429 [Lobosporangium transversale]
MSTTPHPSQQQLSSPLFIPELFHHITYYLLIDTTRSKQDQDLNQLEFGGIELAAHHQSLHQQQKYKHEYLSDPADLYPERLRLKLHTPGQTLVICAQVCRFWSQQLLPLLWHTIRINQFDKVESLLLSAFKLTTPASLGSALSFPKDARGSPYCSRRLDTALSSQEESTFVYSENSSLIHSSAPSIPSSSFPPPKTTHSTSSPISSISVVPGHISAGIISNGHLIRCIYLVNADSAYIFNHPNVSELLEFTCTLLPSMDNLEQVENIIARNIHKRLKRLRIGRTLNRRCSSDTQHHPNSYPVNRYGSAGNSGNITTIHDQPEPLIHHSGSETGSDSSSDVRHSRGASRQFQQRQSTHRSSHRAHRSNRYHANILPTFPHPESNARSCPSLQKDLHYSPYKARRLNRIYSDGDLYASRSQVLEPNVETSFSQHFWSAEDHRDTTVGSDHQKQQQHYPNSHDGTSAIRNILMEGIIRQAARPVLLTHLSLMQYEFIMEEWVEMMQLMPLLQELDLDIIAILPETAAETFSDEDHVGRGSGGHIALPDSYHAQTHYRGQAQPQQHDRQISSSLHEMDTSPYDTMMDEAEIVHDSTQKSTVVDGENYFDMLLADVNVQHDATYSTASASGWPGNNARLSAGSSSSNSGSAGESFSSFQRQFEYQRLVDDDELDEDITDVRSSSTHKIQFQSIRSLIFRGKIIIPELLEYLPNLENLALEEAPQESKESRMMEHADHQKPAQSLQPFAISELGNMISKYCPHICRLVLNEPSLQTNCRWASHVSLLLRAIPQLLHFVAATQLVIQNQDIMEALLHFHGEHLQSFLVLDESMSPDDGFYSSQQQQQPQHDSSFSSESGFYHHPLHNDSYGHGQYHQWVRLRQLYLQVLETCPNLQVSDCKIPLPLRDVIASIPNWACRYNLAVLRLEFSELSGPGVMEMDSEEEAVMEMFIKSLFLQSRRVDPSSSSASSTYTSDPATSASAPESGLSTKLSSTPTSDFFEVTVPSETYLTPTSTAFTATNSANASLGDIDASTSGNPDETNSFRWQQQQQLAKATAFLSTCANYYQVETTGILMALQFLVEHQLSIMPSLDHFFLGSKMFRLPRRNIAPCVA